MSKPAFVATTVVIFFLMLSAAESVGLVPDYIDGSTTPATGGTAPAPIVKTEKPQAAPATANYSVSGGLALSNLPQLGREIAVEPLAVSAVEAPAVSVVEPERIVIPAINLDLAVQNPGTRDIEELDELLKNGPARYVDSAKLGETGGNVIIFAHSSNLPVVRNQMYKAFNDVKKLQSGDTITLEADGKKYLYVVTALREANASETRIDMSKEIGTRLTLVTCDTLTSEDARYVLEAAYVGTYEI